jgi:hypothetical protein
MKTELELLHYDIDNNTATFGLKLTEGAVSLKMEVVISEHDYRRILAAERIVKEKAKDAAQDWLAKEYLGELTRPVEFKKHSVDCGDDHEKT